MQEIHRQTHTATGKKLAQEMSVRELVSQLMHRAKGIRRLGILPM